MRVKLHPDYCISSGACVLECPEVFGQTDEGIVYLLTEDPGPELEGKIRKAASVCPVTVIEIVEDDVRRD